MHRLHDEGIEQLLVEFADDAIRFELRCFVEFGRGLSIKDDLQMAIDKKFHERGIEFAMPRLDIRTSRRIAPRPTTPALPPERKGPEGE